MRDDKVLRVFKVRRDFRARSNVDVRCWMLDVGCMSIKIRAGPMARPYSIID